MNEDKIFISEVLAYLVYVRFDKDLDASVEAWKRLLQNSGWDDADGDGRNEWLQMAQRGQRSLREVGL